MLSINIFKDNWIIHTIHKGIITDENVRINKPTPLRIIIPAAQIIQSGFYIIHLPPIPEGLNSAERTCHGSGGAQYLAPRVIGVLYHLSASAVNDSNDIAL